MTRRPSLESAQSFELLSPPRGSRVSTFSSSDDDEIVWGVSSLSLSDRALFSPRSDDFVVLSPPSVASSYAINSNAFIEDDLISNPPILSQPPTPQPHSPSRRSRRRKNCNAQQQRPPARGQAPPQSPSKPSGKKAPASPPSPKGRRRFEKRDKTSPAQTKSKGLITGPPLPGSPTKGLGARSVVDDVSERGENDSAFGDTGSELSSAVYEKAVHYINCFLSNPLDHKAANLALLQALIIELGFFNPPNDLDSTSDSGRSTSSLELSDIPQSMRAARAFIKSHVFLNVRDYLALRAQGQQALQNVLHPSRKSLVTQLRKKDARVPRDWVKQRGLNVLLVTCF